MLMALKVLTKHLERIYITLDAVELKNYATKKPKFTETGIDDRYYN